VASIRRRVIDLLKSTVNEMVANWTGSRIRIGGICLPAPTLVSNFIVGAPRSRRSHFFLMRATSRGQRKRCWMGEQGAPGSRSGD